MEPPTIAKILLETTYFFLAPLRGAERGSARAEMPVRICMVGCCVASAYLRFSLPISIIILRLMAANRHNCQGRNVRMNSVKRVGWVAYSLVLISPTVCRFLSIASILSLLHAYSGISLQPGRSWAL